MFLHFIRFVRNWINKNDWLFIVFKIIFDIHIMLNPCFIHPAQLHFPVILAAPCPSLGPAFIPIFANLFLFIAFWVAKLHDYKAVTPIRQEHIIRDLLGIKFWSEIYHNKITNDNQLSHDDKENTRIQSSFIGNRNDITAVMFPVTHWPTMTIHNTDHHGLETSMRFVSAVLWNIVGT